MPLFLANSASTGSSSPSSVSSWARVAPTVWLAAPVNFSISASSSVNCGVFSRSTLAAGRISRTARLIVSLRPLSVVESELSEVSTASMLWVVAFARVRKTDALSSSAR